VDLPTDPRERALALLEANHAFPGPFEFRVVVLPEARSAAVGALVASVGSSERVVEVGERRSANGTYVAVRVRVELQQATDVLDAYEVLRAVSGVVTVL
jgi:putative lipoic acid-binding regulatory protein